MAFYVALRSPQEERRLEREEGKVVVCRDEQVRSRALLRVLHRMEQFWQWAIGGLAGLWVTGMAYVNHQLGLKANKESTDKRFEDLIDTVKEGQKENREVHQEIRNELQTTNIAVTEIATTLKVRKDHGHAEP